MLISYVTITINYTKYNDEILMRVSLLKNLNTLSFFIKCALNFDFSQTNHTTSNNLS